MRLSLLLAITALGFASAASVSAAEVKSATVFNNNSAERIVGFSSDQGGVTAQTDGKGTGVVPGGSTRLIFDAATACSATVTATYEDGTSASAAVNTCGPGITAIGQG